MKNYTSQTNGLTITCTGEAEIGDLVELQDDYYVVKSPLNHPFHGVVSAKKGELLSVQVKGLISVRCVDGGVGVGVMKLIADPDNSIQPDDSMGVPFLVVGLNRENNTADILL
ncbi:MAG: hypothetical protein FWG69_04095 [Oscillospiraceae bacterium]|nr:hypothetical protein [Oscillospiraceae bacterium]